MRKRNPEFYKCDVETSKLVKQMMEEILVNFPEREIIIQDDDFMRDNLNEMIYRINENKYGLVFVKYVFNKIVKLYVAEVIKPDTV